MNIAISNNAFNLNEGTEAENDDSIQTINCKYYSIDELNSQAYNSTKHFSVLHLNIASIECHIEELRIVLELLNLKFDFICLSETKIRKNVPPKIDITINGYQEPVGMPTEARKGGVMIFVKNGIEFKPRDDLLMHKSKELESFFLETINKGKNDILGIIYRHPCMDENIFIDDYLKPFNDKLSSENKKNIRNW